MCGVPESDEEYKKGLSGHGSLPADEAMIFDFSDREDVPEMWMKDTTIPLEMIGIDEDGTVIQKSTPKPGSKDLVPFPNCKYVLEVSPKSGIKIGDDFEIDDSDDLDKYTMKVLAPDGTSQMLLQGGERIFSRVSTKRLITRAKRAFSSRNNPDLYARHCKKLGAMCFKEIYDQEHRNQEYVQLPTN